MATPLDGVATWESAEAAEPIAPPPPAPSPAGASQPLPVSEIGERCPSCRARVAADQRYCLECGQRRGDPRLPFMDAVSFMDASARRQRPEPPAPPPPRRLRASANTSLIAGVATLVLAMGVGVLIGRSGGHVEGGATAKQVVVKVPATSGPVTATPAVPSSGKAAGAKNAGHGGAGAKKAAATASANSGKGAESVLHPTAKLPPPTVQVGGSCKGGAGCKNGKFTGKFFEE